MAFEDSDRRRTILLAVLTLVALPVLWFGTRSTEAESASEVQATAPVDGEAPPTTERSTTNRPPLEAPDDLPIFLDGPVTQLNPGVAEIAVPERPDTPPMRMEASYRSTVSGSRSCLVRDLASGMTVTVTNLDNGRTITCVTSLAPFDQIDDIVLHTDAFSLLADLTESPIPVELFQ